MTDHVWPFDYLELRAYQQSIVGHLWLVDQANRCASANTRRDLTFGAIDELDAQEFGILGKTKVRSIALVIEKRHLLAAAFTCTQKNDFDFRVCHPFLHIVPAQLCMDGILNLDYDYDNDSRVEDETGDPKRSQGA